MNLTFIGNGPALLIERTKSVLVVADLHLGIETDMARHGWHFTSQSQKRKDRLLECIHETNPDMLLLLGDVKHSIPMTTRQEFLEIPAILDSFRDITPIRIVPGNHDAGLERFLSKEEICPVNGVVIDGTGYFHGHTIPAPEMAGKLIVAGHHHPMVALQDEVGCSLRAPAYMLAEVSDMCLKMKNNEGQPTRVLFMPAFNELSGFDVQKIAKQPFSPISRCMKAEGAEVFLCDGTYVGPLAALEAP